MSKPKKTNVILTDEQYEALMQTRDPKAMVSDLLQQFVATLTDGLRQRVVQDGELYSTKQASAYLGICEATLRLWRMQGRGPVFQKLGPAKFARVRYRRADLESFIREWTSTAADPNTPNRRRPKITDPQWSIPETD